METKNLTSNNIRETFIKLFPIQFFAVFANSLGNFINGIITGNFLSTEEMVSLGLIAPLSIIIGTFSTIVSSGSSIVIGRYMGKGEGDKINDIFTCAINLLLVCGGIATVVCYVFAGKISILLGATPETLSYTIAYIRGISLGFIPVLIVPALMTFLQMSNKSNISLISTILLAFFITVFGLINVTYVKAGIFGMGVATSLSNFFTMIFIFIYLFAKKLLRYQKEKFSKSISIEIFKLGIPSSVSSILYPIRDILINRTALEVGGLAPANALSIFNSYIGFVNSFIVAIATTSTMLASVYVGEKDCKSVKTLCKVGLVVGEISTAFTLLIAFLFSNNIANAFDATKQAIPLFRSLLIWYGFAFVFGMATTILNSVYACLEKTVVCTVHLIVNCLGIPCIIMYLSRFYGVEILWSLYMLAEIGSLIVFYISSCIEKKGITTSVDEFLYLNKNFDYDAKLSFSINQINDVLNVSEKLQSFCEDNKIDKRRAKLVALCVEEMAGNIVEHGFEKDKKENTIDIFASINNDEISVRLRDNCVPFDPHSKLGTISDDPCKNVGIKLVSKLAKEMNYQTNFGMNVLTIKM